MADTDTLLLPFDGGLLQVVNLFLDPPDGGHDVGVVLLGVDLGDRAIQLDAPALLVLEEGPAVFSPALVEKLSG